MISRNQRLIGKRDQQGVNIGRTRASRNGDTGSNALCEFRVAHDRDGVFLTQSFDCLGIRASHEQDPARAGPLRGSERKGQQRLSSPRRQQLLGPEAP